MSATLMAAWIGLAGLQAPGDEPNYRLMKYKYAFSLPPWEGHGVRAYRIEFTREDLARTPTWAEDAENPPLSARKAIRLATTKVSEITEDAKTLRWKFGEATLVPAGGGKWFWQVTFGGRNGQQAQSWAMQVPVLMDGTVPEPTLDNEYPAD